MYGNVRYRRRDREHVQLGGMDMGRFMLSNLPNLKKLILRCGSKTDIIFGASLLNLEEVNIENGPHNSFHASIPISDVIYLMGLPRLWKLLVTAPVTVRKVEHRGVLVRRLKTSAVTNMHLVLESSSDADFLALVRVPTQLQEIDISRYPGSSCHHEVPDRVSIHDKTLFRALELHKGSLEVIQIFGRKVEHCRCVWDKIESLHDFARLRSLALDPQLFYGTQGESNCVRSLSHLLPASLETIKLYRDPRFGDAVVKFKWMEIVVDLASRVCQPNLKTIIIWNWGKKPFRTRCRRCSWVYAECILCRDSSDEDEECGICYKTATTHKMEDACIEADIALYGPWFEHVAHPEDHEEEDYDVTDTDYEDDAGSLSSL